MEAVKKSHRILVVDDEEGVRNFLMVSLRRLGVPCSIRDAANGEAALTEMQAERPDLVILDLTMPVLDGYQVLARMRADPDLVHLPVLVLTGSMEPETEAKAMDAGANDFVTKPVSRTEFSARVRSLLRMKVQIDELKDRAREAEQRLETLLGLIGNELGEARARELRSRVDGPII